MSGSVSGTPVILGPGGVALNVLSPPTGDGVSTAVANGSGGAIFLGVQVNSATVNDNPDVTAYVSSPLATSGGNVSIIASQTTNATASADNATGGLVGVGDPSAETDQKDANHQASAYVDSGTHIVASGDFTLQALDLQPG